MLGFSKFSLEEYARKILELPKKNQGLRDCYRVS